MAYSTTLRAASGPREPRLTAYITCVFAFLAQSTNSDCGRPNVPYPLTAPAVMPSMMNFCANRNRSRSGRMAKQEPVIIRS